MSYTVAVRALCEFTAKQGDLDLRFTPSPTAQEGIAGHQRVVARRGAGYEAEISLAADFEELHVRGRADGYDPATNRLEEIKTFRGDLDRMPANHRVLHWAQAKVYGALLCRQRELPRLEVALVYLDIANEREYLLTEHHSADALQLFFDEQCQRFLDWARQELAHRAARDTALAALEFPHRIFRHGQRDLAESVFKAASTGRCLLAQAPTGIGKTIGTLFPLLKACPSRQLDKIFFLTAKTPGRQLALDALDQLTSCEASPPLRVLELVARDKACEYPERACHGDSCPLAQGFYDRLPAARAAAAIDGALTRDRLRDIALAHQVCPYYLSQELARWCDVVVGDYNYFFDLSALLHGLTAANRWRVALLVDEAHNLVDRARGMYTAELSLSTIRAVRKIAPAGIKRALERLVRQWRDLLENDLQPYRVIDAPPTAFLYALQGFTGAVSDWLAEHPVGIDPALQRLYFDALFFSQVADLFDEHFLCDLSQKPPAGRRSGPGTLSASDAALMTRPRPGDARLCLRNVVPAPLLSARFALAHTATLFSATLSPTRYYRDLLGLPDNCVAIDVASPFESAQLAVTISSVSTRYRDRDRSVSPIVQLIAEQYRRLPGNYLAFVSSFAYLQQIADELHTVYPQIPLVLQRREMSEGDRAAFLAGFSLESRGVGLAVLGGAFAEGIDLPGERLVGAFVATLGLPQINPVNEQLKGRMQTLFGDGYRYTYLYPGLQKVVQAAGRIIRTETDRGVLHLIDDRFRQREVQALLPQWWRPDAGTAQSSSRDTETAIFSSVSIETCTTIG